MNREELLAKLREMAAAKEKEKAEKAAMFRKHLESLRAKIKESEESAKKEN